MILLKFFLTSLDLLAILRELRSILISARIENIYNLDSWAFIFRIHTPNGNLDLLIESGRRINITSFKYPLPPHPSHHVVRMRHLLLNARIKSIEQIDLDRILYFILEKQDKILRTYFEIFGEGNIIVTDNSGKILYALHQKEMRDRTIRIGMTYQPPPSRGIDIYKDPNIDEIRSQKSTALRALTKYYNLPPEFVEEVLARSSLKPDLPSSEMSEEALRTFVENAKSTLEFLKSMPLKPHIVVRGDERVSVQPIDFVSLPYERIYFDSFNGAVDEYFAPLFMERVGEKERQPKKEEITELENVLARQRSSLKELEEKKQKDREIGELIISNLKVIQELIDYVVKMRRKGMSWDEIKSSSPIKILNIDQSKGLLTTAIQDKEILIDFKSSAAENAERYFSSSKECSRKLAGLITAMKEIEKKIHDLELGLLELPTPTLLKSMKKEWYVRFRWTISSQGFLILGGKDARQNEILVKKHMEPKDIFVHSDVPGGSVVIIKSGGREVPQETKEEAVSFAVAYSKAWRAGLGVADGYWVRAEQVTKTPPTGEYLGKGAFMIYGERNYIRNVPLSIFLGAQIIGDSFRIIVGNEPFVKRESASFVKLIPGAFMGLELAKKIKFLLLKRVDKSLSSLLNAIPESEILAYTPPGGSLPL
ncbi:MAG: ribosome rescue protein RqcH [Candidatus Methanomethylicaceae archaeon]